MALNVCFCVVERLEMGVVNNADWLALVKSLKPRLRRTAGFSAFREDRLVPASSQTPRFRHPEVAR
jgi:hypothetical protein